MAIDTQETTFGKRITGWRNALTAGIESVKNDSVRNRLISKIDSEYPPHSTTHITPLE